MGLDITVYEKIELVESMTFEELKGRDFSHPLYEDGGHFHASVIDEQYRDVTPEEGFYKTSGETMSFRAGSYGGYSAWRRWLAELVGTTDDAVWEGHVPPAFGELINFPDNEGTLKSEVCAKLAKDFESYRLRAAMSVCACKCPSCGETLSHQPGTSVLGEQLTCSDCGGTFDPVVVVNFDEVAKNDSTRFFNRYEQWRKGFGLAANGGAVDFH